MPVIPLMKNTFLQEEKTRQALVEFISKSDRLSMGEKCAEFERRFSTLQQCSHSILFNSGGSANLAMLQALKNLGRLKDGDQIGYSALTWSTNVMPILQLGMQPVAVDCELDTMNISPATLQTRLSETPMKALFITNVLGFTDDIEGIRLLCEKKNIILIEDNCESLGTILPQGKTGNFGLAASFSFYVAHHMSTIEGGMVCTSDDELAEMLKIVRANGWDRNLTEVQQEKWRRQHTIDAFQAKYTFFDLGYNLRPTEITGFLGSYQLQFLDDAIQQREANYLELEKVILTNSDFLPLRHTHITRLSTFAIPVICRTSDIRSKYIKLFTEEGIEIRPLIAGNMQKQPFYSKYVAKTYPLKNTDHIHACGFYCGNYPELTKDDLNVFKRLLKS